MTFTFQISELLEDNNLKCLAELDVSRVLIDISKYWPKDAAGEPRSINSVHEEIRNTPDEVGRNTLRLALEGTLDRGHFVHIVRLARLCSKWSGKEITPTDLLQETE